MQPGSRVTNPPRRPLPARHGAALVTRDQGDWVQGRGGRVPIPHFSHRSVGGLRLELSAEPTQSGKAEASIGTVGVRAVFVQTRKCKGTRRYRDPEQTRAVQSPPRGVSTRGWSSLGRGQAAVRSPTCWKNTTQHNKTQQTNCFACGPEKRELGVGRMLLPSKIPNPPHPCILKPSTSPRLPASQVPTAASRKAAAPLRAGFLWQWESEV